MTWINCKDRQPRKGDEYNVVWVLDDNQYPVTTSMDWDAIKKQWTDPRGVAGKNMNSKVLFWSHLPKPPKGIDEKIWKKV